MNQDTVSAIKLYLCRQKNYAVFIVYENCEQSMKDQWRYNSIDVMIQVRKYTENTLESEKNFIKVVHLVKDTNIFVYSGHRYTLAYQEVD